MFSIQRTSAPRKVFTEASCACGTLPLRGSATRASRFLHWNQLAPHRLNSKGTGESVPGVHHAIRTACYLAERRS